MKMELASFIKETLDAGDPLVRTWPLVDSYILPVSLCVLYVFCMKRLCPALMKNRKPYNLRNIMVAYNFFVVFAYVTSLLVLLYTVLTTDSYKKICSPAIVNKNDYTYKAVTAIWVMYLLKYVEFADTLFFILRKKDHLITNLHVIHHAALPLAFWIGLRSETSGFQFVPVAINSLMHVLMYTYYGLAAMGPEMQKKLWWKRHLTRLQMAQFIFILFFVFVAVPLIGCKTTSHCIFIDILAAVLFFAMFYNFYAKTYKRAPLVIGAIIRPEDKGPNTSGHYCSLNSEIKTLDIGKKRE